MIEPYSNKNSFEDIEKFSGEIVTRLHRIEENEELLKAEVGRRIKEFIEDLIKVLYDLGCIPKKDFYALPRELQVEINKLLADFDTKLFEETSPKLFKYL